MRPKAESFSHSTQAHAPVSLYFCIPKTNSNNNSNKNMKNNKGSKSTKESKRAHPSKSGFVQKPVKASVKKKVGATRKHKGLLGDAGSAIGTFFGDAGIGRSVGNLLGDIFGWGDYDATAPVNIVATNTLTGDSFSNQQPMMHNGDGYARVQHREFIRDLDLYDVFDPLTFLLNPTNATVFPWLSNVARNYEMYKFRGVVIGYRGQGTTFSETGSLGSIAIATQYDVQDLHFTSKGEMLSTLFCTSCKPSDSMMHAIECDPSKTPVAPLYSGINEIALQKEALSANALGLGSHLKNFEIKFSEYNTGTGTPIHLTFFCDTHAGVTNPLLGLFEVGDLVTATAMIPTPDDFMLYWVSRLVVKVTNSGNRITVELDGVAPSGGLLFNNPILEMTRSRPVLSRDTRLNDFARVTLSAEGATPATKIGELWISYDVEFFKPSVRIGTSEVPASTATQLGDIHRTKLRLGPEYDDCKFIVSGDKDVEFPHPDFVVSSVEQPPVVNQAFTHIRHPGPQQ